MAADRTTRRRIMLKHRSAVAVLALGLVLGVSSLAFTQDKPAKPERGERHPQIHAALTEGLITMKRAKELDLIGRYASRLQRDYRAALKTKKGPWRLGIPKEYFGEGLDPEVAAAHCPRPSAATR